ncbi:metal-sulfur cluster assembly factor [Mycolicibacterium moriokaense]|nr:metal-sulfur cluster assembly factor [Mycolicibacterium moriokaense]
MPDPIPDDKDSDALIAKVFDALRDVVDPEIGINVVDLGLVYGVKMDGDVVVLDMTLTSAACPLSDIIEGQVFQVLDGLVADHTINWVWVPPWSPEKLTPEGREQANAIGLPL